MAAAPLPPITLDFETYYDNSYTLKKLDGILYVRDARFEVIGFSYQHEGQAAEWFSGTHAECKAKLLSLELDKREVCAHHAMFDGSILEWIFDIRPLRYYCTMMAARPFVVPFTGGAALRACAQFWGLQDKGDYVEKVSGMHRADFMPVQLAQYGIYSCNDSDLSSKIRALTSGLLPKEEVELIDLTIKKYLRGRLEFDGAMLQQARDEVEIRETKALLVLGGLKLAREDVTSNLKFAEHLKSRFVNVPMKTSPATGELTFAFSKKDPEFTALLRHPDKNVRMLVQARLLLKSSIDRTRLDKFLDVAKLTSLVPVPLLYYGAHTGRFSGMMGINMQNLPKGTALRNALRAPPGFRVIVADLKAIEARITAVLAGELHLIQMFADGIDVYTDFASVLYQKPAAEISEDERFVGKMCILGLGFGMGAAKFALTMASVGIEMTDERAKEIVALYRGTYKGIKRLWQKLDRIIKQMASMPDDGSYTGFGGTIHEPLIKVYHQAVELPNTMKINYPALAVRDADPDHYAFLTHQRPGVTTRTPIWGGGLTENVVQALARIILSRAEVRLARAGLVSVMQVHDELVFVVPEGVVPIVKECIRRIMVDPVPWMPTLPLACSISDGASYGEAK
jgi:DNA polymerase